MFVIYKNQKSDFVSIVFKTCLKKNQKLKKVQPFIFHDCYGFICFQIIIQSKLILSLCLVVFLWNYVTVKENSVN